MKVQLNKQDENRMRDLLSSGPYKKQQGDYRLIAMGLVEIYEMFGNPKDTSNVDSTVFAGLYFFDRNGSINTDIFEII